MPIHMLAPSRGFSKGQAGGVRGDDKFIVRDLGFRVAIFVSLLLSTHSNCLKRSSSV